MERPHAYSPSKNRVNFQDYQRLKTEHTFNFELSKLCAIICWLCMFMMVVVVVGVALAVVLPNRPPRGREGGAGSVKSSYRTRFKYLTTSHFALRSRPVGRAWFEEALKPEARASVRQALKSGSENTTTTNHTVHDFWFYRHRRRNTTTKEKLLKPKYTVGMCIADITMPSVEFGMMGIWTNYLNTSTGIHTRHFARAFCFRQKDSKRNNIVVLVVAEIYAVNYYIRHRLLESLNQNGQKNYDFNNVHLLATVTHWAPACHAAEYMNGIGPKFSYECADTLVAGLKRSILNACEKQKQTPVRLYYSSSEIYYSSINRDPIQYLKNPIIERNRYLTNYDYQLSQLRIENSNRNIIGMINFVPVRANSLPYHNTLLSSDNLGRASMMMESRYNPGKVPGKAHYLMAFAPTNIGDISPHVNGGVCRNIPGKSCLTFRDCNDKKQDACHSLPVPPAQTFINAEFVAENLLRAVKDAIDAKGAELREDLDIRNMVLHRNTPEYRYWNVRMKNFTAVGPFWGCVAKCNVNHDQDW